MRLTFHSTYISLRFIHTSCTVTAGLQQPFHQCSACRLIPSGFCNHPHPGWAWPAADAAVSCARQRGAGRRPVHHRRPVPILHHSFTCTGHEMSVAAANTVQRVQCVAARPVARPARSAGRQRVCVVRSQPQEGASATAAPSFSRLADALEDYRRAPVSFVSGLVPCQTLALCCNITPSGLLLVGPNRLAGCPGRCPPSKRHMSARCATAACDARWLPPLTSACLCSWQPPFLLPHHLSARRSRRCLPRC